MGYFFVQDDDRLKSANNSRLCSEMKWRTWVDDIHGSCTNVGNEYDVQLASIKDETSLKILVRVLATWSPTQTRVPGRHIVPSETSQKVALKIIQTPQNNIKNTYTIFGFA